MQLPVWAKVRKALRMQPLVEGKIDGDSPVYVERWVYQATRVEGPELDCPVLLAHLGGARVNEGVRGRRRLTSLPSQSVLVPARTATSWQYDGPIDDAVFYFLDPQRGIQNRLGRIAKMRGEPMLFSDALVAAAARQIVDELHKGRSADEAFMARLVEVMLEQAFRALTTASVVGLQPQNLHFSRLQRVLRHIDAHFTESMSNSTLAEVAGVSESHFRRIFQDAVGMAPHHYVLKRRLEQARKLLATSDLPISVISDECGFYSQSHLTKAFRATHAVPPAIYRRQMKHGTRDERWSG